MPRVEYQNGLIFKDENFDSGEPRLASAGIGVEMINRLHQDGMSAREILSMWTDSEEVLGSKEDVLDYAENNPEKIIDFNFYQDRIDYRALEKAAEQADDGVFEVENGLSNIERVLEQYNQNFEDQEEIERVEQRHDEAVEQVMNNPEVLVAYARENPDDFYFQLDLADEIEEEHSPSLEEVEAAIEYAENNLREMAELEHDKERIQEALAEESPETSGTSAVSHQAPGETIDYEGEDLKYSFAGQNILGKPVDQK